MQAEFVGAIPGYERDEFLGGTCRVGIKKAESRAIASNTRNIAG
jgi:hypothetical protein